MDCLTIGCGLSGMVTARTLAEQGYRVHIVERRPHIGGNIYDYRNEDGVLVQKYGPHSFFTEHKEIKEYIEKYTPVKDCYLRYVTMINGQALPMPFNFKAIDILYASDKAKQLKDSLLRAFPGRETVTVSELVDHSVAVIAEYGRFMYENEYRLYTAKQWGRPIESISPSVFGRVPVYLSYKKEYEPHTYQFVPVNGFTDLAQRLLDHPCISYKLNVDAREYLTLNEDDHTLAWDGQTLACPVIYTGALDELFGHEDGRLPYRSLEFIWKTVPAASDDPAAIAAWPQAEIVTRVTNYAKLPKQKTGGGTGEPIAIEIPFEYHPDRPFGNEPYYPIENEQTRALYAKYRERAEAWPQLFPAGRLADYKYYNMDHTILKALQTAQEVAHRIKKQ